MLRRTRSVHKSIVPRNRHYSTAHFAYDTRLTSKIDAVRLKEALDGYRERSPCLTGQYLNMIKGYPAVYERRIRHHLPRVLEICRESSHTLAVSENDGIYSITHSPLSSMVKEASRSLQIRCLNHLEGIDWRSPKVTAAIIQDLWTNTFRCYTSIYGSSGEWPKIEGEWFYWTNNDDLPIRTARPQFRSKTKVVQQRIARRLCPGFDIINDVLRFGNDDGYVILKHYLDRYEHNYTLWNYDQDHIIDRVEVAIKEHAITDQIRQGHPIEEIVKQFPEGNLDNFPYPKEQRLHFDRAYAYVMASEQRKEWLRNCRDPTCTREMMEQMNELGGESINYWELRNIKVILTKGWHAFLCDQIEK